MNCPSPTPSKDDVFRAWAPSTSHWSRWVKPVLFAAMDASVTPAEPSGRAEIGLEWAKPDDGTTAYVVDVPGAEGVGIGVALAGRGVRPVPLYNALPSPKVVAPGPGSGLATTVDVQPIIAALRQGVATLAEKTLPPLAPPAFLLDSNRDSGIRPAGNRYFDNRSISFPSDFPTADALRSSGVSRVVIVLRANGLPAADLSQTLRRWQDGGLALELMHLDRDVGPAPYLAAQQSRLRAAWLHLRALFRRDLDAGGFGTVVGTGG